MQGDKSYRKKVRMDNYEGQEIGMMFAGVVFQY